MRGFVAINVPAAVRGQVFGAAAGLRKVAPGVRWVEAENLHLTLKFLGDIPEERVPELAKAIDAATRWRAPFKLWLSGAGAFPNTRRPRVWWIGVRESDALRQLRADVEAATASLGFPRERRPFAPHLTIGRTRGEPRRMDEAADWLERFDVRAQFDVESIELMESRPSPAGTCYTKVASAALGRERFEAAPVTGEGQ